MKKNQRSGDLLDLHGFRVEDVVDAVDGFIHSANGKGKKTVRIMPGKGEGKVKNEVIRYLKMGGFPWEYEKLGSGGNRQSAAQRNEGVLVVFLD